MKRNTGTKKKAVGGVKKKVHHRKKHRMSGIGNMQGKLEAAGGVILGAVIARELNTVATKMFPTFATSPLISGVLQIGVGMLVPMVAKGQFANYIGLGMMANGGVVVAVGTGVISGPNTLSYRLRPVNGFSAVAGPTTRVGRVGGAGAAVNAYPGGFNVTAGVRRTPRHVS